MNFLVGPESSSDCGCLVVYRHARLRKSGLGANQTWDAWESANVEANVPMGLRSFWQENKDKIKADSDV